MFSQRKSLVRVSLVVLYVSVAGPAAFADNQLADSFSEWSTTGTQGENGWFNGYYNLTADGDGIYQTTDFIPFLNDGSNVPETDPVEINHWNGSEYEFETIPPWTSLAQEQTHPNGVNNAAEHWTIRRWQSDLDREVLVIWHLRAVNPGGTGTTGILLVNGVELDRATTNDTGAGVTRGVYTTIATNDLVELALTPEGAGGDPSDGADLSITRLTISDAPLADSFDEWSMTGTQGENGWFNGYYNLTADGDGIYQTTDFIPFLNDGSNVPETDPVEINHWNGSWYDFESDPPWTNLAREQTHPSGVNNAVEHWTIRRWQSDVDREVMVIWHLRAANPGGTGTTGILLVNGVELDRATTNDTGTGVTRRVDTTIATNDLVELALAPEGAGGDPNDVADGSITRLTISDMPLADSFDEWSTTGTQGENGWFNGYYNLTADGDGIYQTTDFIPFLNDGSNVPETDPVEVNHWNGSAYDFEGNPPWTYLAQELTHPNGTNNAAEHWTIRRWQSDVTSDVRIQWEMRKSNIGCGDGVTGILLINGIEIDSAVIAFNDGAGVTRTVFTGIVAGDIIELALAPFNSDSCDDSLNRLTVVSELVIPVELMSFSID